MYQKERNFVNEIFLNKGEFDIHFLVDCALSVSALCNRRTFRKSLFKHLLEFRKFKKKKAHWISVVQKDGFKLQYVDALFRSDEEIVLAAVQQNRLALQFADPSLRSNKQIVCATVQRNSLALAFVDDSLKT